MEALPVDLVVMAEVLREETVEPTSTAEMPAEGMVATVLAAGTPLEEQEVRPMVRPVKLALRLLGNLVKLSLVSPSSS
jgi:hypothetical protein